MFEFLWWQQLLLAVVFVADLAVLAELAKKELNDLRLAHGRTAVSPKDGYPAR